MSINNKPDISAEFIKNILFYDPKTGCFIWKNRDGLRANDAARIVGKKAGSQKPHDYVNIKINGKLYRAHRLAWLYMMGFWPPDLIDHINLDKSDNRWANLRLANHSQNLMNSTARKNNISGFKGVSPCCNPKYKTKKWIATIRIDGKQKFIGRYKTPQEAYAAYCIVSRETRKDFSRT